MKIDYLIYVVVDSHGNKCATVCNEASDTVQTHSMESAGGEPIYFDSDAYHLCDWCRAHDLSLEVINMTADV